jgi:hypothetical protein
MVMLDKKKLLTVAIVAAGIFSIFAGGWGSVIITKASGQGMTDMATGNQTMTGRAMTGNQTVTVVRDSEAILLEGKEIPGKDFIHLYDTTPYMIMNGHIAAKVSCDANSTAQVQVLVGSAPAFKPAELELINELSTPGDLCLYHVDLMSNPSATTGGGNATIITDIAVSNPSNSTMTFPATSPIVIGVNEIMPGAEEGAHG